TGKTLIAKALCNECSRYDRRVTFFCRKGADILSKWVGDSERNLRCLFEQAQQKHPSIIFFDEIDGLAPTRSDRQDQVHSSVVSTLLALMDGLDTRTDVIARKDIIQLHLDQWNEHNKPCREFIEELASNTVGYSGADLHALCSEAAMCSLRRQYPQIYSTSHRVRVNYRSFTVEKQDFLLAKSKVVPLAHRTLHSPGKRIPRIILPLLQNKMERVLGAIRAFHPFKFLNPDCK
ncbi:ATPase family AAA domain-containing protein 2, partial [Blattella germanica]